MSNIEKASVSKPENIRLEADGKATYDFIVRYANFIGTETTEGQPARPLPPHELHESSQLLIAALYENDADGSGISLEFTAPDTTSVQVTLFTLESNIPTQETRPLGASETLALHELGGIIVEQRNHRNTFDRDIYYSLYATNTGRFLTEATFLTLDEDNPGSSRQKGSRLVGKQEAVSLSDLLTQLWDL